MANSATHADANLDPTPCHASADCHSSTGADAAAHAYTAANTDSIQPDASDYRNAGTHLE